MAVKPRQLGPTAVGPTFFARFFPPVAPAMSALEGTLTAAVVVNDTFIDTAGVALTAHTGQTGATWTAHPGQTTQSYVITDANRVRPGGGSAGVAFAYASGVPASADYAVDADLTVKSLLAGSSLGLFARLDTAAVNGYHLRYDLAGTRWQLLRYVTGTGTVIATDVSATLTVGQTYHMKLVCQGTTIQGWVDGALILTATDATHSAAGTAGLRGGGALATDTTGLHLDNFTAATSASTITGALTVTAPLAGTLASTSAVTGALTVETPLAGALAGASTITGALTVTTGLAGTLAGASAVTGNLSVTTPLAGVLTAQSTLTGDLTGKASLAGTLTAQSTITGDILVDDGIADLAGTLAGASTVTGALTVRAGLAGTLTASSGYPSTVLSDSPGGYWRLGEATTAEPARDASGNGQAGAYVGALTLGQAGAISGDGDTAVTNWSATRYVTVPGTLANDQAAWTVEAWVNYTGTPAEGYIYSEGSSAATPQVLALGVSTSKAILRYRNDANVTAALLPTTAINDGVWHHLAGVREAGGTLRLYIDGVERATGTVPASPITLDRGTIGAKRSTTVISQLSTSTVADEVAVYPTALSAARVAAHAAAGAVRLTVTDGLAGTLAAQSAVTGALTVSAGLTGTLTASSALTGNLTVPIPVAGTLTAASTITGNLSANATLAGALTGVSTLTGALTVTAPLAGTLTAASTLTGTLSNTAPGGVALAGTLAGASTVTGAITVAKPLAGTLAAASTLTGNLTALAALAGTLTAATSLTGAVVVSHRLTGTLAGTATVTGAITVYRPLAGTLAATSVLTGTLTNEGPIQAVGTLEASLTAIFAEGAPAMSTAEAAVTVAGVESDGSVTNPESSSVLALTE